MSHTPVDLRNVLATGLVALIPGVAVGSAMVLLMPSPPLPLVLMATVMPIAEVHANGVRHRWWALGAGAAAGVSAGLGINALSQPIIGAEWATLIGLLAGSWIGILTHAAVTHLPTRGTQRLLP